jgi:hypothetical protein
MSTPTDVDRILERVEFYARAARAAIADEREADAVSDVLRLAGDVDQLVAVVTTW